MAGEEGDLKNHVAFSASSLPPSPLHSLFFTVATLLSSISFPSHFLVLPFPKSLSSPKMGKQKRESKSKGARVDPIYSHAILSSADDLTSPDMTTSSSSSSSDPTAKSLVPPIIAKVSPSFNSSCLLLPFDPLLPVFLAVFLFPFAVLSLSIQLDSIDALEREWACSALANLVLEPESVKVLLSHNVIKRLIDRVIDSDPLVQVGAAGALRNLAVEGDEGTREEMLKKDIMTPLLHLFPDAVSRLKVINADPTADNLEKKGIVSNFLEQILVILWCLWWGILSALFFFSPRMG